MAKLESMRPALGADDRASGLWDSLVQEQPARLEPGASVVLAGTGGAALAGAAWARAHGLRLHAIVHGVLAHEERETLALWGVAPELAPSRAAAHQRADELSGNGASPGECALLLTPLDGEAAVLAQAATMGAELLSQLEEAGASPILLVAPAGARAALLGAAAALLSRFPDLQLEGLIAASPSDELPELPSLAEPLSVAAALPGEPSARGVGAAQRPSMSVNLRPVSRAAAASARARFAGENGLFVGHASAAALARAQSAAVPPGRCALALVTAAGEREFSLDGRLPGGASFGGGSGLDARDAAPAAAPR